MDKHYIAFRKQTTIAKLDKQFNHAAAILNDNEKVFVVVRNFEDEYEAAIYEFIDEPEEEFDTIECRLNLVGVASETFEYNCQAMAWCMNTSLI